MICGLSCLCVSKVVNNLLVSICLLDVVIVEVDNCVPIGVCFSPHSIGEDHFFFPIQECSLNLPVVANYLLLNSSVVRILLVVILAWKLHLVVFFLVSLCLISLLSIWRLYDLVLLFFFDLLMLNHWVVSIFLREVSN